MNAPYPTPPAATPLDRRQLAALLADTPRAWPLEFVQTTGSTNTDLASYLKTLPRTPDALSLPLVRVAAEQTAGRGRHGRAWLTQPGDALLSSIACVLPRPPNALAGLSLAVGTALAEGLGTLPLAVTHNLALKWPNDVLLLHAGGAGKLAGILIETVWSTANVSAIVIGIGVNVHGTPIPARQHAPSAKNLAYEENLPPVALTSAVPGVTLTETLAITLNALAPALEAFSAAGFAPFHTRWNQLHAYAKRDIVLLERHAEVTRGVATGVNEHGQLLLDTPAGRRVVTSGDITLRAIVGAST